MAVLQSHVWPLGTSGSSAQQCRTRDDLAGGGPAVSLPPNAAAGRRLDGTGDADRKMANTAWAAAERGAGVFERDYLIGPDQRFSAISRATAGN